MTFYFPNLGTVVDIKIDENWMVSRSICWDIHPANHGWLGWCFLLPSWFEKIEPVFAPVSDCFRWRAMLAVHTARKATIQAHVIVSLAHPSKAASSHLTALPEICQDLLHNAKSFWPAQRLPIYLYAGKLLLQEGDGNMEVVPRQRRKIVPFLLYRWLWSGITEKQLHKSYGVS